MFGKDLGTALKYDFLDLNYHDSGTGTSNPSFGIPNVASVYGNLTASYEVAFSLLGTARLDLGSLKTSFNFNSHADASPNHPTPNGGAFIDTSRFTSSDILQTGIHATGANAENSFIKMELGASLDSHVTATVGYNYDIFVASGTGSKTIIDNDVSLGFKPTEIFKITGEDLADAFTRDFKYGSLSARCRTSPMIRRPWFRMARSLVRCTSPASRRHS